MTGMPCSRAAGHRGQDRLTVLGQDDQRISALGDQVLDIGQLLLGRGAGIRGDVGSASSLEGGDDRGLVELGPPFFVVVVPGNADDELVVAAGRRLSCRGGVGAPVVSGVSAGCRRGGGIATSTGGQHQQQHSQQRQ